MSKNIVINTPKGQYQFPLELVARDRANYYDSREPGSYQEEYDYIMEDNFEGIDWLLNNMDWADVEGHATKINDKILVTEDDFFTSSDDIDIWSNDENN